MLLKFFVLISFVNFSQSEYRRLWEPRENEFEGTATSSHLINGYREKIRENEYDEKTSGSLNNGYRGRTRENEYKDKTSYGSLNNNEYRGNIRENEYEVRPSGSLNNGYRGNIRENEYEEKSSGSVSNGYRGNIRENEYEEKSSGSVSNGYRGNPRENEYEVRPSGSLNNGYRGNTRENEYEEKLSNSLNSSYRGNTRENKEKTKSNNGSRESYPNQPDVEDNKIYFLSNNPSSPKEPVKQGNNRKDSGSKRRLLPEDICGLDVPRRIIGGTTTDIDEFPWLCLLQYVDPSGQKSHDCSGVLISKRYVLTAAHCTNGLGIITKKMKLRKIRLGEWDISSEKDCQGDVCSAPIQEIDVEEIIPHEKYKPRQKSQVHDIALVRLRDEAKLNQFVQPICLPFDGIADTEYEGKKLTVAGWGKTSNARDSSSDVKMKVDLPVVNRERCRQFYQSFFGDVKIAESQFCAGGESGQDSCQGDSGGPLMTTERTKPEVQWFVIGIVSSGPAACGVEDRPSLYTNVSQYIDWILENIKE